ncbi:MAG: aminotransferase, partial [Actinobacteria bacterium]|nr:aminotransferase [Actinomycetota bacterium]
MPVPIQEKQTEWRRRWEAGTTAFILEEYPEALEASRRALAGFLSASVGGLAFTRNATSGVASV